MVYTLASYITNYSISLNIKLYKISLILYIGWKSFIGENIKIIIEKIEYDKKRSR